MLPSFGGVGGGIGGVGGGIRGFGLGLPFYQLASVVVVDDFFYSFRLAERRLSSAKIQNLVSPLQVFREENIREPSYSCSLKRKTSVSLHCQYSGNTLRSCYQMLIFLIESLDGETILTRTSVCHRQLS